MDRPSGRREAPGTPGLYTVTQRINVHVRVRRRGAGCASVIWGFMGIVCVLYIVELLWRAAT